MDYLQDLFRQLQSAGPEALTALLCLVVGYLIRKVRWISNRFIPLTCLLVGGVVYPLLMPTGQVSYEAAHPTVRCIVIGLIIGFLVWTVHKALLKPLEVKFPWLTGFLEGVTGNDSNPKAFKRSDFPEVQQPQSKEKQDP